MCVSEKEHAHVFITFLVNLWVINEQKFPEESILLVAGMKSCPAVEYIFFNISDSEAI